MDGLTNWRTKMTSTREGWQPIETAPTNGDYFNMFCYGEVFPAYWHISHHSFFDLCRGEYVGKEDLINAEWQPLPKPPTGEPK